LDGLINWPIAGFFIGGGAMGGWLGTWASHSLAARKRTLTYIFSAVVILVGVFVTGEWVTTALL
jgi:uncharacterized membrane protein YfcA